MNKPNLKRPAARRTATPPVTFEGVWSNSPPMPEDEELELGTDGSFRVRRGEEVTPLDIPGVVELILQGCLSENPGLWPQFAAYLPSLYPDAAPRWTPPPGLDPALLERATAYAAENGRTLDDMMGEWLECAAGLAPRASAPSSVPPPARPAAPLVTPDPAGNVTVAITLTAPGYGLLVAMAAYERRPDVESTIQAALAGNLAAFCEGMKQVETEELILSGKVDFNREGA